MYRLFFVIFFIITSRYVVYPQHIVSGYVVDLQKKPLFAVSISIPNSTIGTATNNEGFFTMTIDEEQSMDTLQISYLGYNTEYLPVKYFIDNDASSNIITLTEATQELSEVVVFASPSISKEFAIERIDAIDIYMTPSAGADPLRAISRRVFNSATESAEPELRGSSGDNSRVYLNNVPLYKPIRNQQLNGVGNFSILNSEMIKYQDIYPSNPPLKMGGSIAGLIDAKTIDNIDKTAVVFDASLANVGLVYSQKINKQHFFQLFGNYQFSPFYKSINPYLGYINKFSSHDSGINYRFNAHKHLYVNFYSYFINEMYNSEYSLYNYTGESDAQKKRNFNIVNVSYNKSPFSIDLNIGTDASISDYRFGAINQNHKSFQLYTSLNAQYYFDKPNITLQGGFSMDNWKHRLKGEYPIYYSAISPSDPASEFNEVHKNINLESFIYAKWNWHNKIILGLGFRKNMPTDEQDNYLSYQGSIKYNFNKKHSLLLSLGKYNAYSVPENNIRSIYHMQSNQYSLDYTYNTLSWKISASAYAKTETMPMFYDNTGAIQLSQQDIKGAELSIEYFHRNIVDVGLSYALLDVHILNGTEKYFGYNDIDYMLKAYVSYYNSKLFNVSINYTIRPGYRYTPLKGVDKYNDYYIPIYGIYNTDRYNAYSSLDLSINRYFKIKKTGVVVYASVNNLLNRANQQYIYYNHDYTEPLYRYYQKRTFYFGFRLSW